MEVHVAGHVIVNPEHDDADINHDVATQHLPGGVPDGAVIVHPQGCWLGVVGGGSQGLGLVNEHIRHPEVCSSVGVEGEVRPNRVHTVHELFLGGDSLILKYQISRQVFGVYRICFLI